MRPVIIQSIQNYDYNGTQMYNWKVFEIRLRMATRLENMNIWGPFLLNNRDEIRVWISDSSHWFMWCVITCPYYNFNATSIEDSVFINDISDVHALSSTMVNKKGPLFSWRVKLFRDTAAAIVLALWLCILCFYCFTVQPLSLSWRTFHRKIARRLETARFRFILSQSL